MRLFEGFAFALGVAVATILNPVTAVTLAVIAMAIALAYVL
jgi:hypothetical protein